MPVCVKIPAPVRIPWTTVAAAKARTQVTELTAIKGFSFEDMLRVGLASIAAVHGDIAEPVGRKSGLSGTQNGDHLVTLNAEDTCGEEARFQLAYAWARWVCRRDLTADGTAIDAGRVEAALSKARQALARQQAGRGCFTLAHKKIDEGIGHMADLVDEVRVALDQLSEELNKG